MSHACHVNTVIKYTHSLGSTIFSKTNQAKFKKMSINTQLALSQLTTASLTLHSFILHYQKKERSEAKREARLCYLLFCSLSQSKLSILTTSIADPGSAGFAAAGTGRAVTRSYSYSFCSRRLGKP